MFLEFWLQASRDKTIWEASIAPYQRYHKYFTSLIKKGVDEGSFAEVDPELASRMIVSTAMGLSLQSLLDPKGANWEKVARDSTNLLVNSLLNTSKGKKDTQMKIVTDCAADMSAEELKELGVVQAPLFIQFPEGEVNSADISADDFYNRLEAIRPAIPTTAQPSGGIFAELYRKIAQVEKDILSIHISSGLSGTINSARAGGEQVENEANVSYWDTLSLSGGERFQVIAAALAARANWALHSIQERLEKIREKTEVIYTLDSLEYLARGGRIGRVKALAGALLNLKPIIRVDSDGRYSTVGTGRTLGKSINAIAEHLQQKYTHTPVWVTVLHGRFAEKAEILANELKAKLNIQRFEINQISPVLGVHTGPGIVGAAVVPMELMEDLIH